jgi:hypothetical protein
MPIVSLSNSSRSQLVGVIRKGGEKDENSNKPGPELEYFRMVARPGFEAVEKAFYDVFGDEPTSFYARLTSPTIEEVFPHWFEQWRNGHLMVRCDGDNIKLQRDRNDFSSFVDNPGACPRVAGRTCSCKAYGSLVVRIPELLPYGISGVVSIRTSSITDIREIVECLTDIEEQLKDSVGRLTLKGVELEVYREPETITHTLNDGSKSRREHHMIKVRLSQRWVAANAELLQPAPPQRSQVVIDPELLDEEADVDEETGVIDDNPDVTEEAIFEATRRSNVYKHITGIVNKYLVDWDLDDLLNIAECYTLAEFVERSMKWSFDGINTFFANDIVLNRIPVKIYGVGVRETAGKKKRRYGVNFGFGVAYAYSRDVFRKAGIECESWTTVGDNIAFDEPLVAIITKPKDEYILSELYKRTWSPNGLGSEDVDPDEETVSTGATEARSDDWATRLSQEVGTRFSSLYDPIDLNGPDPASELVSRVRLINISQGAAASIDFILKHDEAFILEVAGDIFSEGSFNGAYHAASEIALLLTPAPDSYLSERLDEPEHSADDTPAPLPSVEELKTDGMSWTKDALVALAERLYVELKVKDTKQQIIEKCIEPLSAMVEEPV